MRLWSTTASIAQNEPTVLAITETVTAMSICVWIAVHFGTWTHVIIGAAIAPLLLLRTDTSCVRAQKCFGFFVDKIEGSRTYIGVPLILIFPIVVIGLRIGVTLVDVLTRCRTAIQSIPSNWWRVAIASDSVVSPEWLPLPTSQAGLQEIGDQDIAESRIYHFVQKIVVEIMDKRTPIATRFLIGACVTPWTIGAILSGIAYRWSIKSTAVIWFPLLWALQPTKPADRSWETYLRVEADLKKPQLVAVVSVVTLALFAFKYILWVVRHNLAVHGEAWRDWIHNWSPALADSSLCDAIIAWVRPGAFPLWQIAAVLNSVLGVFMWLRIRRWLAEFKNKTSSTDESIAHTFKVTFFFRRLLTSYAIVCNGFIAWHLVRKLPVPPIGSDFFPWL